MNCHGVGQQTMDNLNRQTRSTRPKPLFSVMRLSKSKLFWTAMGSTGFSEKSLRNDFSKESGDRSEGCSRGKNAFSISGRCPKSKIPAFRQLLFSLHAFLLAKVLR